jgi:lipopolysaccharide export LptBFGC system permease protein LptF
VAEPVDFIATSLSPKVLLARRGALFPAVLSLRDLQRLRQNPAVAPAQQRVLQRTLWGRFSFLVLNVLLMVMALPFFLRPLPTGGMKPALNAVAICLGSWASAMFALQASPEALPPAVSAWLPVAVALPTAAILLTRVRT